MKEEKAKLHQKKKSHETQARYKDALKKKILEDERYKEYLQSMRSQLSPTSEIEEADYLGAVNSEGPKPQASTKNSNLKQSSEAKKPPYDTSKSR